MNRAVAFLSSIQQKPGRLFFFGYCFIAGAFLILTNLSYINYTIHQTNEYRYTGATPHASIDKLVYMSMIEQGRNGKIFMKNLHTNEPQRGVLFSPHWYAIGQTARLLNISNETSYQVYRVIFTVGFLWILYLFITQLASIVWHRLAISLLVLFSGGLGGLYVLFWPHVLAGGAGSAKLMLIPSDMYVTEGNTLMNFAQAPLFSLSQLMILVIMYCVVRYRSDARIGIRVALGIIALVLSVIHPYDVPIILVVLGSWVVWHFATARVYTSMVTFLFVVVGCGLGVLYNIASLQWDPVIGEWLKQNLVYSPPFPLYAWGYGFLLPLWAIGAVNIVKNKRKNPWWVLFLLWSSLVWVLLYFPTILNRRFVNGFHIALAIVAFDGLYLLFRKLRIRALQFPVMVMVCLGLLVSTLFFMSISMLFNPGLYKQSYFYTRPADRAAIEFLRSETTPEDSILTLDFYSGFFITAHLDRALFRGHNHQTPQFELKDQQIAWFRAYQQSEEVDRRKVQFLKDNRISYLVVNDFRLGPSILTSGTLWMDAAPYLEKVFESDEYRIFRVRAS